MRDLTNAAQAERHDGAPDIFIGTHYSVDEIVLGLRVLTAKVRQLKHSHETRNVAAMKLDAEGCAKVAGQIEALASHLGSVCVRYINRRPRP